MRHGSQHVIGGIEGCSSYIGQKCLKFIRHMVQWKICVFYARFGYIWPIILFHDNQKGALYSNTHEKINTSIVYAHYIHDSNGKTNSGRRNILTITAHDIQSMNSCWSVSSGQLITYQCGLFDVICHACQ